VGTNQHQHRHQQQQQLRGASKRLFCYVSSTSLQRAGDARFTLEHIDVQRCTHVILAFADVVDGKYIRAPLSWTDWRNGRDLGVFMADDENVGRQNDGPNR